MTLIDQRIIIDAPPHVVWEYISDLDNVRRWHTGYRNISALTTQQTGMGTRRRCAVAGSDKDVIEEITAWVEGLGYEYAQVEGGSYRSLRARLRLQAVPDGTSVQWTITYQPRGVMGRLRDLLGGKRRMQSMMADSLRTLRRMVDELGLRMDADYRERVSMRGRLNHAERQEYQSRYTSEEVRANLPEGVRAAPPPIDVIEANAAHVAEPSPPGEASAVEGKPSMPEIAAESTPESARGAALEPALKPTPKRDTQEMDAAPGAAPSFVNGLLEDSEQAPAEAASSYDADTEPRPPEGWREMLEEHGIVPLVEDSPAPDSEAEAAPDADVPTPSIPPRPIPEVSPLYSKAPTRPLDAQQLDAAEIREPDVPAVPAPDRDQSKTPALLPDSHSHPTPPHGIPSVRAQRTMPAIDPNADLPGTPALPPEPENLQAPLPDRDRAREPAREPDEPVPAPGGVAAPEHSDAPAPESASEADLSSSAPTPPHGIPSVQRSEPDALSEQQRPAHLPPPTPKTDTGEMSIWEVFGEQRPSEEDSHALEDLIESVNAKEVAEWRRRTRWAKRPARVRHMQRETGLRLRLALREARVRGIRTSRPFLVGDDSVSVQ